MNRFGLLFLPFISLACTESIDVDKETKDLLETDREFAKMSIDKGAAAAFEFYMTPDALALPNKNHPVYGRENIVRAFGGDPGSFKLEWTPEKAEVSASADMGWTWGKYKQTVYTDADDVVSYGKYLNIWKKQEDGTWRLAVDIGNNSPGPEN